jgi:glycosyltransferase involved in cell wall biosynthesis
LKIALIIMDLQLGGGAEHDVVNLSTGLHKAGHTPVVITSGGRLCENIEAEGIPVLRHPVNRRSLSQLRRNAGTFEELVLEHGIDVLNPQGVYPALSCHWASRALLRRNRAVPNVVTIHMLSKLTWYYYKAGAILLNRTAEHVIFESECERDRLLRRGLRRPLTVIPNCFPASKLSAVSESRDDIRRELGCPPDRVLFIMPARMTAEKRHDLLLDALSRPEVRELPIRFCLAGDGPLLEQHKARARELGLQDRVSFLGFRRDVPRLYRAADVFLLCSSAESLPLSIREGMGASLPVIATNVGGIPEAVEDQGSGILVPSGDAPALAQAIRTMAASPELRNRMGRRGNEIYQAKFDYDHWIRRTIEVMSEIRDDYRRAHGG